MFLYYLKQFLTLNFKLKIDPKLCTFKNLEEILNKRVATLIGWTQASKPRPQQKEKKHKTKNKLK